MFLRTPVTLWHRSKYITPIVSHILYMDRKLMLIFAPGHCEMRLPDLGMGVIIPYEERDDGERAVNFINSTI